MWKLARYSALKNLVVTLFHRLHWRMPKSGSIARWTLRRSFWQIPTVAGDLNELFVSFCVSGWLKVLPLIDLYSSWKIRIEDESTVNNYWLAWKKTEIHSAHSCFRSCSACCHPFCFQYCQNENCKSEKNFQETFKNSEVESIFETLPTRLTTFHQSTEKLT